MKKPEDTTVVVGMSGGVDSSVAALLLARQGYNTIGLFMKNWEEKDENGVCTSAKDFEDVAHTCAKIGIPYYSVNLVEEYQEHVFKEFISDFEKGHTPNPDILCNREIKFAFFYDKAMEMGADFVATGHYCQVKNGQLIKGIDAGKDQTYFLNAVPVEKFQKVLFPIGHLEKHEVRRIAKENGLPTHDKKDSTGICFIGERKFRPFLSQFIKPQRGDFCRLNGEKVGSHEGVCFYTLGQRKHLGLGGEGSPWYVVKKDVAKNIVYVERDHDHPELFRSELLATELNWLLQEGESIPKTCQAKIRYRQADQECSLTPLADGSLHVSFKEPQRAVATRQSVALYDGERCLGGGFIS